MSRERCGNKTEQQTTTKIEMTNLKLAGHRQQYTTTTTTSTATCNRRAYEKNYKRALNAIEQMWINDDETPSHNKTVFPILPWDIQHTVYMLLKITVQNYDNSACEPYCNLIIVKAMQTATYYFLFYPAFVSLCVCALCNSSDMLNGFALFLRFLLLLLRLGYLQYASVALLSILLVCFHSRLNETLDSHSYIIYWNCRFHLKCGNKRAERGT